ncbi:MAG: N-6 DNA methylase [Phycisphaerales bacterium]|nr:N-6 DNA methylase [Phycisphaerales bacterium]
MPPNHTRPLLFGPVRNSELFANHWLERRLPLEPEWTERRAEARACLDRIADVWRDQEDLAPKYGGEQTLEEAWIQPVLEALGWPLYYQTFIKGRKPDYALFLDKAAKRSAVNAGKTDPHFWKHPTIVADAKAWDVSLDHRAKSGPREYPPEQIEWYMNQTGLEWGLLTNGQRWRLIPRQLKRSQPRFETFLELNLPLLLSRWLGRQGSGNRSAGHEDILNEFLRWYLLVTPPAFQSLQQRIPLIERALKGSTEYRLRVGDELRDQVFEALRLCIEGFLAHKPNALDPGRDLEACRANSFTLLFRLLFILFAEDRQLLPYKTHPTYTKNRSLTAQHNDLLPQLDGGMLPSGGTGAWRYWSDLFDLIDRGHASYGVTSYNGGLFDSAAHPFLSNNALPDQYAARVLDSLRRATDPDGAPGDRVSVDYRDLAIQHLGNIYEGLLELRPRHASEPMVIITKRDGGKTIEKTVAVSAPLEAGYQQTTKTHAPGEVYLETDKGERRASGSYYTPDHIVSYIVENTLGPLCREIGDTLTAEITALESARKSARNGNREAIDKDLTRLRAEYDDRVLRLAVLDPAMGSGHFLLSACQYLAAEIATNPNTADPDEPEEGKGDAPTLLFWKRRVIERCIYGVDKNPIAVELAKLALWLETVSAVQPLSFLDHHLRHGDSLIGARIEQLGTLHDQRLGATALAPGTLEGALPSLLKPLEDIRRTPSATVPQVKEKEHLYRDSFEAVRRPFARLADLWTSVFFTPEGQDELTPAQYQEALNALSPTKFRAIEKAAWFAPAVARATAPGIDAFHWEFEFPEVFLSPGRKARGRVGFDAIIGNPPYDVLAEKELGRDLTAFKGFIEAAPIYDPSRRGKNNLYKLFICRALDLLADGGRFGFIVPMPLLGDDQAADIRKAILKAGAFTAIEAFPQKDDPTRRVFPEAKLSTTIFTMVKTDKPALKSAPFQARQHPANKVEAHAPSLTLRTADIPLYDPDNGAIVTCSQADWDLAVQLMQSGRLSRLGTWATSFQGEANESNDIKKGTISYDPNDGPEIIRGAHLCLYCIREASQGTPLYVRTTQFLRGKSPDSKAHHHHSPRVGFQRKSPQNNFRRLVACPVPAGTFLLESVSYVPEPLCKVPLEIVTAMLNSQLCEWYFRLGSTNAMVGEYQFNILPCPIFADDGDVSDTKLRDAALGLIKAGDLEGAFAALKPALASPPFPKAVQEVLVDLVKRIIRAEKARGSIARVERSKLAADAQPLQALIDRIIYALAGLTDAEAKGLEERLAKML